MNDGECNSTVYSLISFDVETLNDKAYSIIIIEQDGVQNKNKIYSLLRFALLWNNYIHFIQIWNLANIISKVNTES